jgi:hypothetical protein
MECYVSFRSNFQPNTYQFGGLFAGEVKQETAICKDDNYYILNGDHRDEYEKLVPKGFEVCKAYFDSKPELRSSWSNR